MNNKNTIIGLVLIFLIFIVYSYLMTPSKEEIQKQQRAADSIARINQLRTDSAEALRKTTATTEEPAVKQ
jgi:YidC/Oxa1 family membrane protein insertase